MNPTSCRIVPISCLAVPASVTSARQFDAIDANHEGEVSRKETRPDLQAVRGEGRGGQ